jgi:uncharacterized protein (DUF427 family)
MFAPRYYPETKEAANNIKGYVAFYKVSVSLEYLM